MAGMAVIFADRKVQQQKETEAAARVAAEAAVNHAVAVPADDAMGDDHAADDAMVDVVASDDAEGKDGAAPAAEGDKAAAPAEGAAAAPAEAKK